MKTETDTIDKHFTLCEAAPDLLAALEKITDYAEIYLRHSVDGSIGANMLSEARAAIAKAKGDK